MQQLRDALAIDPFAVDLTDEKMWNDIHAVCGVLKLYIRELKEPVLTVHLYDQFIASCRGTPKDQRAPAIKKLLKLVPAVHYSTLEFLIRHLARVAQFSAVNKVGL